VSSVIFPLPSPSGPPPLNGDPILLVEDNPDDVTFIMRAFKKNNITNKIVVVTDGEQALGLLLPPDRAAPPRMSVVLLDVKLPKIDGLEVLRTIRADFRTQTLPVVVLTTSNEERDIVASYRLGANSFVRKPMQFTEFVDATRIIGLYWLLVNLPAPGPTNGS
jgi:two-component system, response regulator